MYYPVLSRFLCIFTHLFLDNIRNVTYRITLYGKRRRQEKRQQTLLLRRRKCPRRRQAPHRSSSLPRYRRETRRDGSRSHRPRPPGRHHPRVWLARRPLGRRSANRRLGLAAIALACATLRTFARSLSLAGRHPPHLPAWPRNRSSRLVSLLHPVNALGVRPRTFYFASVLGRF